MRVYDVLVALGRSVHPGARDLEAVGRQTLQGGRQVGVDVGLDGSDALLAPTWAAERRGLADADRAVGEAEFDDDVALRRRRDLGEFVAPQRRHVHDRAAHRLDG